MPGERSGKARLLFGLEAVSPRDTSLGREGKGQQSSHGQGRRNIHEAQSGSAEGDGVADRNSGAVLTAHVDRREKRLKVNSPQRIPSIAHVSRPEKRPTVNSPQRILSIAHVRRIEQRLPVISPQLIPQIAHARGREQRLPVISPQPIPSADSSRDIFLPLPEPVAHQAYGAYIGFALCVLLPMLIATVYFGLIASNQYVAEFRFTVQDTTPGANLATSSIMALTSSTGGAYSPYNYVVADFLTSRESVEELQRRIKVTSLYAKPEADWWSRFNSSRPMEKFVLYWQKMATAQYDQVTGIATATVRAFTPEDALLIANSMVTLSEELVNRIANRSQTDAVRYAQIEVGRAEERLKAVRARMTEYRNRTGVIDPTTSVVASNATLIQTLRANLAQLETQLAALRLQNLEPNTPVVMVLMNQIKSTKEQLEITEATVGGARDGTALSKVMAEYEQLDLERQFAQNMVTSTMQALDQARAIAASQHLYITPYVRPSLPQSSIYPHRLMSIATVGILAFVFWVIGLLIVRSIRERIA